LVWDLGLLKGDTWFWIGTHDEHERLLKVKISKSLVVPTNLRLRPTASLVCSIAARLSSLLLTRRLHKKKGALIAGVS